MTAITRTSDARVSTATRITLTGRVQGIGLRPAVVCFAQQLSLTGYIGNTQAGVVIQVEGRAQDVQRFERNLRWRLPAAAEVCSLSSTSVCPVGCDAFVVKQAGSLPSVHAQQARMGLEAATR